MQPGRTRRGSLAVALAGIVVLTGAAVFAVYGIAGQVTKRTPAQRTASTGVPTLALTVTGPQCHVFVRVPGGDILVNRTLTRGQSLSFDDARLNVVLSDAGAVRVSVNGTPRPPGRPGERADFAVTRHQAAPSGT